MSNATPPPLPPPLPSGPGSPRDVPPLPGDFGIDPATLPKPIRDELLAPDPVAIDTSAAELKDGLNRCPRCGASDIRHTTGSDLLICRYCRHEWRGTRVEEAFGLGEGIDQLRGTVVASGAQDIQADASALMSFKCTGCGAEVTVNTDNAMTARCHWCRHVFGVNEQVANGAVPDAVLPFHITKDDAVARIRQFVGKRKLFALKTFKKEFTPENVIGVYLPYMIVDANVGADVAGHGEIKTRMYLRPGKKGWYFAADVYQVERHVDFTVDDLPLESSSERGNLETRFDRGHIVNAFLASDIKSSMKELASGLSGLKKGLAQESSGERGHPDTRASTNNIINTILPFDTKNAVKWNASYLSGFSSEKRDRNVECLRPQLEDQLLSIARAQVEQSVRRYDRGVRWEQERLTVHGTRWVSMYLPVWLYSYHQPGKNGGLLHYIAVNGRTGETMGSVPIQQWKLIAAALSVGTFFEGIAFLSLWGGAQ